MSPNETCVAACNALILSLLIHVVWTDNLLDHLRLGSDHTLYLYYHVSVLRRLKQTVSRDILPAAFFDETIDTLALLIPRADPNCSTWYRQNQTLHLLDSGINYLEPASRDTSSYCYWCDRLQLIEETFDESEPATLSQWWHDRRKKVQWYTFWVAILVLALTTFFGLIQSVAAVVQAWASIKSLQDAG